jgi:indolepyruvate ferredoxin oxidoreductase
MAYKDEYEVARLHLRKEFRDAVAKEFGEYTRFRYLLHPPTLRTLGMKKKIKLGRWFDPVFKMLIRMRFLRYTV